MRNDAALSVRQEAAGTLDKLGDNPLAEPFQTGLAMLWGMSTCERWMRPKAPGCAEAAALLRHGLL